AGEHREDAEEDLRAEGGMDGDGRRSRALELADLAGENDEHGNDDPGPPAVHEMQQEEVVGHREACAVGPVYPLRHEAAVHGGRGVGYKAGAEPRAPGAEHELDEEGYERDGAPAAHFRGSGIRLPREG